MYQLFSESIKGHTIFLDSLKKKRIDLSKVIDASKMQIQPDDADSGIEMSEDLDEDMQSANED